MRRKTVRATVVAVEANDDGTSTVTLFVEDAETARSFGAAVWLDVELALPPPPRLLKASDGGEDVG